MSNLINKIFGGGASQLVDSLGGAIDNLVTSKEEKLKLKNEAANIINSWQAKASEELTRRQQIDMNSDSWLSKNIRPLTLIFILLTYTAFSITDENLVGFDINESYVQLLGEWGRAIMYFYFGGRTLEKAVGLIKSKSG